LCRWFGKIFYEEKMAIRRVGVVGCGLMGSGIAQWAAASGFETVVREVSASWRKGIKGNREKSESLGGEGSITDAAKGESVPVKGTTSIDD